MADRNFILAPETVTVSVGLEPTHNILNTFIVLADSERLSGFPEWVVQTASSMSPEQRHTNKLMVRGFFDGLLPEKSWSSFPAYLDHLAAQDPVAIRDKAVLWMNREESPGKDKLLGDLDAFLSYEEAMFAEKEKQRDLYDPALYTEVHALLNNPPALLDMAVKHLRALWDEVLRAEWERVEPMLQEAVDAFQQLNYSGLNAFEAVRLVTGRDMSVWWADYLPRFKQIIFVPSAHMGPYIISLDDDSDVARIVFGARVPQGVKVKSSALSRSELMVQLSALADDTRLRILELLTETEELCAQDIITLLDLSQSSASRHLRQLTATGYLTERRREVSKCYSLNVTRIDDTLAALKLFLRRK